MTRRQGTPGKRSRAQVVKEDSPVDPKGLTALSDEADKTLGERRSKIVKALGGKAEKGSIASAKLLVDLAARNKRAKRPAPARVLPESLAARLAMEPEWPLTLERAEDADAPGCLKVAKG